MPPLCMSSAHQGPQTHMDGFMTFRMKIKSNVNFICYLFWFPDLLDFYFQVDEKTNICFFIIIIG